MDRPPQRQWDPMAPSLLWAHELRREHVRLAEELDSTRTDLTSTTNTVTDLAKKIDDVYHQIQDVQTRCDQAGQLCKAMTDELEDRVQRMVGRFEALETEHAQLKSRVELFEKEYADRIEDWTRRFGDMEMRLSWTRQVPVPRRSGSEVLAPDSMPVDQSALVALSIGTTRGLSDTTWGSSSPTDARLGSLSQHEELVCPRDSAHCATLRQDGLGLLEYLDMAEGMGGLDKKDSLGRFVCGLRDSDTQAAMVRRLDVRGWSWGCLRTIVIELERDEGQGRSGSHDMDPNHDRGDRGLARQKSKKKRPRRSIPIVPADEDDLRVLDWHNARR